jgi:hypothetical protein
VIAARRAAGLYVHGGGRNPTGQPLNVPGGFRCNAPSAIAQTATATALAAKQARPTRSTSRIVTTARGHSRTLAQTTVLALPVHYVTRRGVARWRLQRGTGRGNRSTGERLSRPLEGAKPARRGLHLLPALRLRHGTRARGESTPDCHSKSARQPFKCHSPERWRRRSSRRLKS